MAEEALGLMSESDVTMKALDMAERAFQQRDKLAKVLTDIEAMPFSSVNDSESLRHTIRTMQTMARTALAANKAPQRSN